MKTAGFVPQFFIILIFQPKEFTVYHIPPPAMKITEKTLIVLSLMGLGMTFMNISGGSVLTIMSVSALTFIYYLGPLLFNGIRLRSITKKGAFEGIPVVAFVAAFFGGFALCAALIGSLFRFQIWPGGSVMLLGGLIGAAAMSLICYGISKRHNIELFTRYLSRAVPICGVSLLLYLTPVDALIDLRFDDPQEAALVKKTMEHPEDEKLQQELEDLRKGRYE